MSIYTMFPQMPHPMPLPSTSPEDLQHEIAIREARMTETGINPHIDKYGRIYTHKSTSNVSNTMHGVYFTVDVTNFFGLDDIPAFKTVAHRKSYPGPARQIFLLEKFSFKFWRAAPG